MRWVGAIATAWGLTLVGCLAQPGEPTPMPPPPPVIPPPPSDVVCEDPTKRDTAFTPARLLTRFEYDNTVRDLLHLPSTVAPSAGFPAENRVNGFDNNAIAHVVNPLLLANYIDAAEAISEVALSTQRDALVRCNPVATSSTACGHQVVAELLPRAFRRPATHEELAVFEGFFDRALAADDFDTAIKLVVQATLQSPQLLYRIEPGDGSPPGSLVLLTDYALASRLSYFLWSSAPDEALLQAAANGSLDTAGGYRTQVERLLADPRAQKMVQHFHRQWLETEHLATITKDQRTFPAYSPDLRASWIESIDRFVAEAYFEGGGLDAFLKSPDVWVDAPLARSLGVAAPPVGQWTKLARDPARYAGILTQPGIMANLALPNQGSPIRRGVFVREQLLCQTLPVPPPNVPITPPDPSPTLTTRERFVEHTRDAYCAACHTRIDPVGFAFEAFDSLGVYREMESGKLVDVSGSLTHLRDPANEGPVNGAVELAAKLAGLPEVTDCVTRQWFRYAIGREMKSEDSCSFVNAETSFEASGGDFLALLQAIAETDAFHYHVVGESP